MEKSRTQFGIHISYLYVANASQTRFICRKLTLSIGGKGKAPRLGLSAGCKTKIPDAKNDRKSFNYIDTEPSNFSTFLWPKKVRFLFLIFNRRRALTSTCH